MIETFIMMRDNPSHFHDSNPISLGIFLRKFESNLKIDLLLLFPIA